MAQTNSNPRDIVAIEWSRPPVKEHLQNSRMSRLEKTLEQYTGPRLDEGDSIPDHNCIPNGNDIHPSIIGFKLASHYSFPTVIGGGPRYLLRDDGWYVRPGHEDLDPVSDSCKKHIVRLMDDGAAVIGLRKIGEYHHPGNLQMHRTPPLFGDTYWYTGNNLGWVYHLTKEDINSHLKESSFYAGKINPVGSRPQFSARLDPRTFLRPGQLVVCVDHTGWGSFQYQLLREDPRTPHGQKGFLYPVQGFRFEAKALSDPNPISPVPAIAIIDPKRI